MYEIHNLQARQLEYIKSQFDKIKDITYQPAKHRLHYKILTLSIGCKPEDTLLIHLKNGGRIFVLQALDHDFALTPSKLTSFKPTFYEASTLHNVITKAVADC